MKIIKTADEWDQLGEEIELAAKNDELPLTNPKKVLFGPAILRQVRRVTLEEVEALVDEHLSLWIVEGEIADDNDKAAAHGLQQLLIEIKNMPRENK